MAPLTLCIPDITVWGPLPWSLGGGSLVGPQPQLSDTHHSPHPSCSSQSQICPASPPHPISSISPFLSLDGLPHPTPPTPPSCQNAARGRNRTLPQGPPSPGGIGWAARKSSKSTTRQDICLRPLGSLGWGGAHGQQPAWDPRNDLARQGKTVTKFRRCEPGCRLRQSRSEETTALCDLGKPCPCGPQTGPQLGARVAGGGQSPCPLPTSPMAARLGGGLCERRMGSRRQA